jgi:catechol 2,3-dioxygenase-like lactoylglutathione lyase family enzyme
MLSRNTPVATLATADMTRARTFYEDTLGLTPGREETEGVFYDCGAGAIFVYRSAYAGTNKATAVTFGVAPETFDAEIDELRSKGVTFMTFDLDGVAWKDGVASMGESLRAAWFADPDGNIINVSAGMM